MCATTAASEAAASAETEAPSELDLLLDRITKEAEGGRSTVISHQDVCLIVDLANEHQDLAERYEARVLIEKAKEALAEHTGLKLSQAFRMMQQQASAKNKTLEQIAEITLVLFEGNKPKHNGRKAPKGKSES